MHWLCSSSLLCMLRINVSRCLLELSCSPSAATMQASATDATLSPGKVPVVLWCIEPSWASFPTPSSLSYLFDSKVESQCGSCLSASAVAVLASMDSARPQRALQSLQHLRISASISCIATRRISGRDSTPALDARCVTKWLCKAIANVETSFPTHGDPCRWCDERR